MSGTGIVSIFKRSLGYGLAQISGVLLQYFLIPIYARVLSTTEYGVIFLMISVAGVTEIICKFSLNSPLVRYYYDETTSTGRKRLFGTFFWLQLVLAAVILAGALGAAKPLNRLITASDPLLVFFVLSVIAGALRATLNLGATLFRVRNQVGRYIALVGGANVVQKAAVVVALLGLKAGLAGYFWATAGSYLVYFVACCFILLRTSEVSFRLSLAGSALIISAPLAFNQLLAWVTNLSDRILLNRFYDSHIVAIYSLSYTFGFLISYLVSAFFAAWPQYFFQRHAEHGDGAEVVSRHATYLWLACAGLAALVSGCVHELILTLATPDYAEGVYVTPVVAAAYSFHALFAFSASIHVLKGKAHRLTLPALTGAVLNLGLNLLLLPYYGFIAAAWVTLVSIGVASSLSGWLAFRIFPLRYEKWRIGKAALSALVVGAIGWNISWQPAWTSLSAKLILLPMLYGALLYALRFFSTNELGYMCRWLSLTRYKIGSN